MLGRELVRQLHELKQCRLATCWGSSELDIKDREDVATKLGRLKPTIVLNAAAYTDVDGCERNQELAHAVNAAGPAHLAEACRQIGAIVVHFSTDFIFDGTACRPYQPQDSANPISVYGHSKWNGEEAIRQACVDHLIIRTSWLFGPGGRNFVDTILARAETGQPLRVVTDQVGRPTFSSDLAEAVLALLDARARGVVHFANADSCSWFEFAVEIVRQAGLSTIVEPITSDQLDRPARRPAYSVLDTEGYTKITGRSIASWRDALRRYMRFRRPVDGCRALVSEARCP